MPVIIRALGVVDTNDNMAIVDTSCQDCSGFSRVASVHKVQCSVFPFSVCRHSHNCQLSLQLPFTHLHLQQVIMETHLTSKGT